MSGFFVRLGFTALCAAGVLNTSQALAFDSKCANFSGVYSCKRPPVKFFPVLKVRQMGCNQVEIALGSLENGQFIQSESGSTESFPLALAFPVGKGSQCSEIAGTNEQECLKGSLNKGGDVFSGVSSIEKISNHIQHERKRVEITIGLQKATNGLQLSWIKNELIPVYANNGNSETIDRHQSVRKSGSSFCIDVNQGGIRSQKRNPRIRNKF